MMVVELGKVEAMEVKTVYGHTTPKIPTVGYWNKQKTDNENDKKDSAHPHSHSGDMKPRFLSTDALNALGGIAVSIMSILAENGKDKQK